MATIPEALAIALQHHQGGQLQAAEQIYRQILAVEPKHADALHLLGVIAAQMGKLDVAVEYLGQAIGLNGNAAAFHNNLGNALRGQQKRDEAVACYRRALALNPDYAEAAFNLGNVLRDQGKLDEAAASYRRALALKPDYADAHTNLGLALKRASSTDGRGKLDEVVACYRRALELKPNSAEAHNNLGVALHDQGKLEEAIACCRRALELKPDYAEGRNNLGNVLRDQGKLDEAAACYRTALELKPNCAETHNNLGAALNDQGKPDEAIACFRRALELKPDFAEAHNNLGNALNDQGKPDEAIACFRTALELKPDFALAHNNLGVVLKDQGALDEAVASCRTALELQPDYAEAVYNLGNALKGLRKLEEAVACYCRALELNPDYAEAHNNLGLALMEQGNPAGTTGDIQYPRGTPYSGSWSAVACFRQALELKPEHAEAHNNLGVAFKDEGKLDAAIACFRRAVELKPDFAVVHQNLGNTLKLRDRYAEARAAYEQALRLNPDRNLLRLSIAAICPALFDCNAAIDEYRAGLLAQVEELAQGNFKVDVAQLGLSAAEPPFNLLYHGRDNRPLKAAWARLFRDLPIEERARRGGAPSTLGRGRRPKLGLVVTQSHEGIFLRYWAELLRRIKPGGWEMVVVCSVAGAAQVRTALSGTGVQLLPVFGQFDQIVKTIREARFDVLCHWEAGSDSTNYFLPYFRLAPVQCSLIGMPETTGIPQMDYYLSSDLVEAEGAEAHYSEQLLRGSSMLAYHTRPSPPAVPKPREAFGVRPGQHLYVCPQNLRKFHPDFDPLLAGILERDPAGVVAVVEDRDGYLASILRRRFASPEYGGPAISEVLDRVLFRPYADYLGLVSAADVVLDSLYYGGGTTTLEALAFGKPIVTLPWRYSMGRSVLGCYRRMGIAGFVAEDAAEYVRMAVALGTDADYRQAAGREINAASGVLFEDAQAARDYERIFARLIEEAH